MRDLIGGNGTGDAGTDPGQTEGLDSRDASGVRGSGLGDFSGNQEREVRMGGGLQLGSLSDCTNFFFFLSGGAGD